MRPKILILILLLSFLLVSLVTGEDAIEWNLKGQDALTVGDYSAAVTYFNKAIQQDKNLAPAYAGRAAALNRQGKYLEAIASADSALAIKSMDPVALNARAYAFFGLGQYEEAASAYDKFFLVEQNRKEAYCNQAYAYMKINRTDAATVAFDRCTLLDSQNMEAWNNKGLNFMQAGKYEEALAAFDRATTLSIKNATIWNNKGVALVALGRPSDALECFNKALGIDPDYADAKANKEETIGKQQSFTIYGTITPEVTISRIGTFYTTVVPTTLPPEVTLQETGFEETVPTDGLTDTPAPTKTTYSPLSLQTVLLALAAVAGMAAIMKRE